MLAHHPLTGQPAHQTMRRFVLPIPETFQTSFHLHTCPPESKEQTATSSLHGAFTPYYSVSRGHARGTSRGRHHLSTQLLAWCPHDGRDRSCTEGKGGKTR